MGLAVLDLQGAFLTALLGKDGNHGRLFLQEGGEVIDEQSALVDGGGNPDEGPHLPRDLSQGTGVQGVGTDLIPARDHAVGEPGEEGAVDHRGDHGDDDVPHILPHDEGADAREIAVEGLAVTADEGVRQVEHANLLDHVLVDHEIRVVVHLSAILGAAAHILEVLTAVVEIDDGRGNRDGDHDQSSPPQLGGQDHHKGNEGDDVTDHGEGGGQDLDGTHTRLAVGVLQLLVEGGEIEGAEIQLLGLVHDLQLDGSHHQLPRDTGDGVLQGAYNAVEDVVGEHEDQQEEDRGAEEAREITAEEAVLGLQLIQHRLGDLGAHHGHDTLKDGEEEHGEKDPRACFPDQLEYVAHAGEESAQKLSQIAGNVGDILGGRDLGVLEARAGRGTVEHRRNDRLS